jgi:hypothetical protein
VRDKTKFYKFRTKRCKIIKGRYRPKYNLKAIKIVGSRILRHRHRAKN